MNILFSWLLAKAKDYVLKNWKTTLLGVIGSVLVRYIPDEPTRTAVLSGIVAALGIIAKDADQTGTTLQPREVSSVTAAATESPHAFIVPPPATYDPELAKLQDPSRG